MGAIYDLPPQVILNIEARLRPTPKHFGYLDDKESLLARCCRDRHPLNDLGVHANDIASKIDWIKTRALVTCNLGKMGCSAIIADTWRLTFTRFPHAAPEACPFSTECPEQEKTHYLIEHLNSGKQLAFTQMSLHLIGVHIFFGGHSPYRIEPAHACTVLELNTPLRLDGCNVDRPDCKYTERPNIYTSWEWHGRDLNTMRNHLEEKRCFIVKTIRVGRSKNTLGYVIENPAGYFSCKSRWPSLGSRQIIVVNPRADPLPDTLEVYGKNLDISLLSERAEYHVYNLEMRP